MLARLSLNGCGISTSFSRVLLVSKQKPYVRYFITEVFQGPPVLTSLDRARMGSQGHKEKIMSQDGTARH